MLYLYKTKINKHLKKQIMKTLLLTLTAVLALASCSKNTTEPTLVDNPVTTDVIEEYEYTTEVFLSSIRIDGELQPYDTLTIKHRVLNEYVDRVVLTGTYKFHNGQEGDIFITFNFDEFKEDYWNFNLFNGTENYNFTEIHRENYVVSLNSYSQNTELVMVSTELPNALEKLNQIN